ncbi:MAG: hypothetical protein KDK04_30950, partial [Candidatus Competibacteraceae bacterium]|nr:hypothetical protein [Candidatus Competibacteraceae bacterium]
MAQRNASLKGQISRADLLRCLQCHGEDSISGLAIALGYSIKETEAYIDVTMPAVIVDAFGTWQDSPAASVIGTEGRPKAKFHRVIAKRELDTAEVATDPPEWFKTAERFQDEAELSADPTRKPPKPQPLMRWSRLWPFLKCALGEQHKTQAVDLPPVVNKLARGEALSMLPRKCRAGWAESCQIIIDFAEPLLPFWGDFNTLQQRLRRFRGGQGLSIIAFPQGDPFGECWRYADNNWVTHEYRKPAPGTPILLLSDLGCNDQTDTRQRLWRRFGLRLKRAGHRPVVLLPSPSRWWDAEVTQWFYPVCWDRASKPPRRPGQRRPFVVGNNGEVRKDADPGAEQLLALLAPAIRVEPALLRAVRYLLQPRLCDVGSEAAVWNHPKITATPLAFYYPGTAQGDYRQRFQEQAPALRQRAGELITVHHAHLSPAIVQEEQWLLAELSGQSMQASRDFLARIVKTMQSEHEAFEGGMQAWLARMIQRQPKELFANNEALAAAWLLAQKPKMQAGEAITPPAGVNPSRLRWLLAAAAKDYTLRQRGMTLRLELGPKSAEDSDIAGSFFSTISMATDTLQIQQANDAIQLQHRDQPIALNPQGQLRLQTDWHELTIDSIAKPEWAESIGRDAHGLFVTWADGQRKAYWLAPDRYPVTLRGGRVSKAFELNSGFWCDESEALILQREGFQQPKWAEAFGVDEYGLYAEFSVKGVMQRMRWIAPGEFMMGSPEDEPQREDDEVLHKVILSQ